MSENPFQSRSDRSKLEFEAHNYVASDLAGIMSYTKETGKKIGETAGNSLQQLSDSLVKNLINDSSTKEKKQGIADEITDDLGKKSKKGLGKQTGKRGVRQFVGNQTRNLGDMLRGGKNAKTAANVGKGMKATRAVRDAKRIHTAIKIGRVAKLAAGGGAALAGGPVGIAAYIGITLAAEYAIGKIWKNREQIYDSSKNVVNSSKIRFKEAVDIVKAKQGKVGEVVPEAANLTITDQKDKLLFKGDENGKVLNNEFAPDYKLTFFQENDRGEKTEFLQEPDDLSYEPGKSESILSPDRDKSVDGVMNTENSNENLTAAQTTANVEDVVTIGDKQAAMKNPLGATIASSVPEAIVPEESSRSAITPEANALPSQNSMATPEKPGEVNGSEVVSKALSALALAHAGNPEVLAQVNFIKQGLTQAGQNQEAENDNTPDRTKDSVKLNVNQAGSDLIAHFNANSRDNENLSMAGYSIERKGHSHFLKDGAGKTLLEAKTGAMGFGSKILQNNLSDKDKENLKFLGEDLNLGKTVTGPFKIGSPTESKPSHSQTNSPAKAIVDLLGQNGDGEKLETKDYNIQRRGKSFLLTDKATGSLLLHAKQDNDGVSVVRNNLSGKHRMDLKFLSEDLELGQGITGAFKSTKIAGKENVPSSPTELVNRFTKYKQDSEATKDEIVSEKKGIER